MLGATSVTPSSHRLRIRRDGDRLAATKAAAASSSSIQEDTVKTCPSCNTEGIRDKALRCPNCKAMFPARIALFTTKVLVAIFVVTFLLLATTCVMMAVMS